MVRPWLKRIALWCIPTLLLLLAWQVWDRAEAAGLQKASEMLERQSRPVSTTPDETGMRQYLAADILLAMPASAYPIMGRLREALESDRPVAPDVMASAASFVNSNRQGLALAALAADGPLDSWTPAPAQQQDNNRLVSRRVENAYAMAMLHAAAEGRLEDALAAAVDRARLLRVFDRERFSLTVMLKASAGESLARDIAVLLGVPLSRDGLDELDAALAGALGQDEIADAVLSQARRADSLVTSIFRTRRVSIPPFVSPMRPLWIRRAAEMQRIAAECIAATEQPWPELLTAMKRIEDEHTRRGTPGFLDPEGAAAECTRTTQIVARALAMLRAARTAVRVERHRLATGMIPGTLPESLTEPAVEFADPFTGQPMRIEMTPDGYTIYSVGGDGRDDGGGIDERGPRPTPLTWVASVPGKDVGVRVKIRPAVR